MLKRKEVHHFKIAALLLFSIIAFSEIVFGVIVLNRASVSDINDSNQNYHEQPKQFENNDFSDTNIRKSGPTPMWSYLATDVIRSVSISSDGSYIVAGDIDGFVHLFHKSNSTPLWSYEAGGYVVSVSISSDGNYITAGSTNKKVFLFHKSDSEPQWTHLTTNQVKSVSISSDGSFITAGNSDGNIYIYGNSDPSPLRTWTVSESLSEVSISADGTYVAAGSQNNYTYLFSRASPTELWKKFSWGTVRSVAISSDGEYVASGAIGHIVSSVYKLNQSGDQEWVDNTGWIDTVAISANGSYLAASGRYGAVKFYYDKSGSYWIFNPPGLYDIKSVAMSADGYYIVVGCDDNMVYLLNKYNTVLWNYTTGSDVLKVAISADGNYITAGSVDKKVYLFYNGKSPAPFTLDSDAEDVQTQSDYNLIWDRFSDADNYTVFEGSTPIATGVTAGTYPITVSSNGYRYYKVKAHNIYDNTTSNTIEVFVNLGAPKSFRLSSNAGDPDRDGAFNLTWTVSVGADNYTLYADNETISVVSDNIPKLGEGLTGLLFNVSELINGDYYYKVKSLNETGNNTSNCLKVSVQKFPSEFVLSSMANNPFPDGSFYLNWTDSIEATNYSIFYYSSPIMSINSSVTALVGGFLNNSYRVPSTGNETAYYLVVAYNQYGSTFSNCLIIGDPQDLFVVYLTTIMVGSSIGVAAVVLVRKRKLKRRSLKEVKEIKEVKD